MMKKNEPTNHIIFKAISDNNIELVQQILQEDKNAISARTVIDLNRVNPPRYYEISKGQSPLHEAVKWSN